MKTFQYKKVKYQVPENWSEVPLKSLMKMKSDVDEFKTDSTRNLALISAYAGIPVDILKKSKVSDVTKLFKYLTFLSTDLPTEPIYEFDFKGEHYTVADTLIKQEFQDFISVETVLSDNDGNTYKALPTLLAILCKRDGESLDDYDVEERAKMFLDLPITIAHPLSVFFCNQEKMSMFYSQLYSNHKSMIAMRAKSLLATLKPQDGMGWLMRLQIGLLRSWIRFTMLPQSKCSTCMLLKSYITKCKKMCKKLFRKEIHHK